MYTDQVPVTAIHDHAVENLQFIRKTLERAGSFTAVPGKGGIGMGVCGLVTAWLAHRERMSFAWAGVWIGGAVVAAALGLIAAHRKATRSGSSLLSPIARKFAMSFAPPLFAGALISGALLNLRVFDLLAGTWLVSYGTAVITGGAYSVRVIPLMGVGFVLLGALSLFLPLDPDLVLALGFGILHIVTGVVIARNYGG